MSDDTRSDEKRIDVAHLIEAGTSLAHPVVTPLVKIGRDPTSDVLVRDATVSRLHAEVRTAFGIRTLTVAGSTGARLNDERVEAPVVLTHGDLLEIGSRRFTFHEGELPNGVLSYVGHGQEAPADPLLQHTTQSNPVIEESSARAAWRGRRAWGLGLLVVITIVFAYCVSASGTTPQ